MPCARGWDGTERTGKPSKGVAVRGVEKGTLGQRLEGGRGLL